MKTTHLILRLSVKPIVAILQKTFKLRPRRALESDTRDGRLEATSVVGRSVQVEGGHRRGVWRDRRLVDVELPLVITVEALSAQRADGLGEGGQAPNGGRRGKAVRVTVSDVHGNLGATKDTYHWQKTCPQEMAVGSR